MALDFYVMRRALALVQRRFELGADVEQVVAVLDEVGGRGGALTPTLTTDPSPSPSPSPHPNPSQVGEGLFAELDFATEARHSTPRMPRLPG